MNPGHQPQRFEVFTELADGTGFTLKECSYIFLYDKYGGWFDEHRNYYNSNADPSDPPSESEDDKSSQSSYSQGSQVDDEFERQFGPPPGIRDEQQDDQSQQQTSILETIAQNQQRILAYPQQQPLRVYFKKLSKRIRRNEFLDRYCSKIQGKILNIIIDVKNGRNQGTGYFIVNPQIAKQLIHLQRQRIANQILAFDVQSYQNYLILPITQKQIEAQPKQEAKLYIPKSNVEVIQEPQKEQIKWCYYKFEKALFPKKTSFKVWMTQNGFNENEDFKNPEKIQGDDGKKYARINMKQIVYKSCSGLPFLQKKIQFIPL